MTPDQYTLEERQLDVGDGHQLYVMLWGNAKAKQTFIFLHGGPGSGCTDYHRTLFDPAKHRAIFFDQRGCGKSLPYGSLEKNTTDELVEDISKIADAFGIKTFTLTGGSWGSTLALMYALKHPERVERMVLRGIFTARASEIGHMDDGGIIPIFPDVWARFTQGVPKNQKPRDYHVARMFGDDPKASKESAYAYGVLESSIIGLDDRRPLPDFEAFDPVGNLIECHYLKDGCFIEEGYILREAKKLTMPIQLIQGRYDMVCPPVTAYELAQALPNAELFWTQAGHSGGDRANYEVTKAILAS